MEKVAFGSVTYGGADASPFTPSPAVFVSANISMKFPAFYPDATKVWFAQPDAQFAIKYITVSKTKFYHAVAILPQEVAAQLLNLIRTPPAVDLIRYCKTD